MSFSIVFQKNNSPKNKVTKSLTNVSTLTGEFRNETDLMNPIIRIEADSSIVASNYLTISTLSKSYFITSFEHLRNNLWNVHCHIDVLSTYATAIKANKAVVLRQANSFNMLLDDGVFKVNSNPRFFYRKFATGLTNFNYILITAG